MQLVMLLKMLKLKGTLLFSSLRMGKNPALYCMKEIETMMMLLSLLRKIHRKIYFIYSLNYFIFFRYNWVEPLEY